MLLHLVPRAGDQARFAPELPGARLQLPAQVRFVSTNLDASLERDFTVKIPSGLGKGDHRILLSDADTVNRMQNMAGMMNRFIDLPETVSLINQERSNNRLYVSVVESSPTAYYDDKTMPSLPASVLNVMQAGRASNRPVVTSPESATQQAAIPFDFVVSGSYSLKITVK